jgi:prevent-host-death family protein
MNVPITEAKAQLTELVRRAEAGEEVVLTRHGRPVARLSAVALPRNERTPEERRALLKAVFELQADAAAHMTPGPDAAHSADFLYDENGLPA